MEDQLPLLVAAAEEIQIQGMLIMVITGVVAEVGVVGAVEDAVQVVLVVHIVRALYQILVEPTQ